MKNEFIACAASALLAAGIVGYASYTHRVSECKEAATQELWKAVGEEVTKRDGKVKPIMYLDGAHTVLPPKSEFPQTFKIRTATGAKEYVVTWHQSSFNISNNPDTRLAHSIMFREQPLDADTLAARWNQKLRQAGFGGTGLLRVCMDVDKPQTVYAAGSSASFARADSLTYLTMGGGCEWQLTASLAYRWWQVYTWAAWVWTVAAWAVLAALSWLLLHFREFREGYLVKTVEVPVSVLSPRGPRLHRFSDGATYDKDTGVLKKGEDEVKFTAKPAGILLQLIEADGRGVPIPDLVEQNHLGSVGALHKAVSRLRDELAKVTSAEIRNRDYSYWLYEPEKESPDAPPSQEAPVQQESGEPEKNSLDASDKV